MSSAQARISVGVLVERRKAQSAWIDFTWKPVTVLVGEPEASPWTMLSDADEITTYLCWSSRHRTASHRNRRTTATISLGDARLWVSLRPTGIDPPYEVFGVTADPAEGEGWTETGTDLVDVVAMPEPIRATIEAFVAEHHVDRPFYQTQTRSCGSRTRWDAAVRSARNEKSERGRSHFSTRWARRKRDAAKDAPAVAAKSDASDEPSHEAAIDAAKPSDPARSRPAGIRRPHDLAAHLRSRAIAGARFDHGGDRHPRIPGARRSGGAFPCGPSTRVERRSGHPGFRRPRRLRLGLQYAGGDLGLWAARDDRGTAPADRPTWSAAISLRPKPTSLPRSNSDDENAAAGTLRALMTLAS